MAVATLSIPSQAMCRPMPVTALLPDQGTPAGVLYLLHGFSNCHATFIQNSNLVRYCDGLPLLVVMPEAGCSFYADSPAGLYWQFISQELPACLNRWFRLPDSREQRFVGGISMGGYGAAKWALQQPDMFSHAFLLAPVTDLPGICSNGFDRSIDENAPTREALRLDRLFPQAVEGTNNDLYHLLHTVSADQLPHFSIYTGSEDFLLADTRRFVQALEQKGLTVPMTTRPGIHGWDTWEPFLQDMIRRIAMQLSSFSQSM